jgi:hypothetical protein
MIFFKPILLRIYSGPLGQLIFYENTIIITPRV